MLLDQTILIDNIFSLIIGCCFGSFINVIIYRLPLGLSIVHPRSFCRICKYKIRWFENIPIFSWILLRGSCANCRSNISITYPIIELITGILFLLNNYSSPTLLSINSGFILLKIGWIFISLLLILAILDIKYFWLPSSICIIGLLSGLIYSLTIAILFHPYDQVFLILGSIFGAILGYLIFQLISALGFRLFKKPSMGKGDAKLAAFIGSWLGIKGLLITIWLAFNLAGIFVIIGLLLKRIKSGQKIPFGTFLALSALLVWYLGEMSLTRMIYLGT
tara:strand:- start:2528 stop:3358 length:831 start_codon:yes stop_codon:yes gene_type:complete